MTNASAPAAAAIAARLVLGVGHATAPPNPAARAVRRSDACCGHQRGLQTGGGDAVFDHLISEPIVAPDWLAVELRGRFQLLARELAARGCRSHVLAEDLAVYISVDAQVARELATGGVKPSLVAVSMRMASRLGLEPSGARATRPVAVVRRHKAYVERDPSDLTPNRFASNIARRSRGR